MGPENQGFPCRSVGKTQPNISNAASVSSEKGRSSGKAWRCRFEGRTDIGVDGRGSDELAVKGVGEKVAALGRGEKVVLGRGEVAALGRGEVDALGRGEVAVVGRGEVDAFFIK